MARKVVDTISFTLQAGERLALVGPNGAGKSTLLKSIAGLLPIQTGSICIEGQDISQLSALRRAQLIGYLPQRFEVRIDISVYEFLKVSLYPVTGLYTAPDSDRRILDLMNQFKLQELSERSLLCVSGGELQRVLLASALVHKPKVLLLDEPGSFLDPYNYEEIMKVLFEYTSAHALTVLSVSHDLNLSALWNHTLLALKCGRSAYYGEAQKFMTAAHVQDVFGYSPLLVPHPQANCQLVLPRGPQ
jgi:iron complex transport system ATP-binding protein